MDPDERRCFHWLMRNTKTIGLVLSAAIAAASWGCGNPSSSDSQGGNGGSNGGSNSGGGNPGGSSQGGSDAGPGGFAGAAGSGQSGDAGAAGSMSCAGSTEKAELIPLDMYIMLDKSGSMTGKTGADGNGPAKWDAVTAALNAFFTDQGSAGLGVGIQFFPIPPAGTPDTCTNSNQCGAAGPCLLKSCTGQGVVVPCNANNECLSGQCATLGQCQNNPSFYCFYSAGAQCGVDPNGNDLGACQMMNSSYCVNPSCSASDYSTPAVEIDTLNGAAAALNAAIAAKKPQGNTPTAPALDGAVKHAQSWAQAHPDHKVVAVLATDGLPTQCDPLDIDSIAQIAADGVSADPSVLTFVIGVFGQADAGAQQNLDQIAQAGGTTSAFFITDNQNVTMAFLDALHQIQGKTLSCEYQIPTPKDGSDLDYDKVNVKYTPAGSNMAETILYVGNEAGCDAKDGGWYYDQDPKEGKTPTKILMCPVTCDELKAAGGQVEIQVGCKTEVAEPK